jgi:virginiamycin B lyase
MPYVQQGIIVGLVLLVTGMARAGGSNYGITPGSQPQVEGKISEWQVPTPKFARDPAPGPDGNIYIAVMHGNKIARFDTHTQTFHEALDKAGNVWFCEIGAGKLGKFDPKTGIITELTLESGSQPRRMATAPDGSLWVTLYGKGKLLHIDLVAAKVMHEYVLPGGPNSGPYAVTVDGAGIVWTNEFATDTIVLLDPQTGQMRPFLLPSKGIGIRKMIVDAEGRLWYMGSHNGRLGVLE